jgi:sugar/nucleoside kinase (ribokinase family)/fructoselysine-6-P-deglycase FrlB-like protein
VRVDDAGVNAGGLDRVVVVGNLTIDDVVQPDGTTFMARLGGNSVHVATAAVVCGAPVALVTRRGADFPLDALDVLATAGVDLTGVREVAGPTVRNWVVYESDGRRHWLYRTPDGRSAEVAPTPADLPAELLESAAVVHVAAMPLSNAEQIVAHVRQVAPTALLTLDTHEAWTADVRDRVLALAGRVDLFVPSLEELEELTGATGAAAAIAALGRTGLHTAVVKAGADGAYVLEGGSTTHLPARATVVTDTTGAGDAFCGGLAAGLAGGLPVVEAVALGVAVAGTAIGSSGSLRLLESAADADTLRQRAAEQVRTAERVQRSPATAAERTGSTEPNDPTGPFAIDVMRREIAMIPDIVAAAVDDADGHLRSLAKSLLAQDIRHLWLTGCGDSAFAGQAAALAFHRHTDVVPRPSHALDLARYQARYLPVGSAVLGVSFSGKVGRTTEALVQAGRLGHPTYALTNAPEAPLARAADGVVPLDVQTLGFSPGTSTYVAMLGSLLRLAAALSELTRGDETLTRALLELPGQVADTLDLVAAPSVPVAEALLGRARVMYLGAGPNEATARFGAAKLFEGPQQLGVSTNLEEWAHEEYFVTTPDEAVVLVNPTGAAFDRGEEIRSELSFVGVRPVVVTDSTVRSDQVALLPLASGVPEELSPVTAALPLALVGYHVARLAGKQSYNFPSEAARTEHYDTIHRATIGDPA